MSARAFLAGAPSACGRTVQPSPAAPKVRVPPTVTRATIRVHSMHTCMRRAHIGTKTRGGTPLPPRLRFWALLGPQGPHESTGSFPRTPWSPREAPGTFSGDFGFWPLGGLPNTEQKPIKSLFVSLGALHNSRLTHATAASGFPRLLDPSKSIWAVFLIRMVLKMPQEKMP